MIVDGEKFACEACIRGHRTAQCQHTDRPLQRIGKQGRPVSQCGHCRTLRNSRSVHTKCECRLKARTAAFESRRDSERCLCFRDKPCTCAYKNKSSEEDAISETRSRGRSTPLSEPRSPEKDREPTPLTPSITFSENSQTFQSIAAVSNAQGLLAQGVADSDGLATASPLEILDNTPTTGGFPTPDPPADDDWMRLWSLFPDLDGSFFSPELQIADSSLPVFDLSTLPDTFATQEEGKHDEPPGWLSGLSIPLNAHEAPTGPYNDLAQDTPVFEFPDFGQSSHPNTTILGAADTLLAEEHAMVQNDPEGQANTASNLDTEAMMNQIFASSYGTSPM